MSKETETITFADGSSYEVPIKRVKTMNKLDDLAWKREFDRVEAKQKQRASKQRLDVIKATYSIPKNTYTVKDNDNETNNQ